MSINNRVLPPLPPPPTPPAPPTPPSCPQCASPLFFKGGRERVWLHEIDHSINKACRNLAVEVSSDAFGTTHISIEMFGADCIVRVLDAECNLHEYHKPQAVRFIANGEVASRGLNRIFKNASEFLTKLGFSLNI